MQEKYTFQDLITIMETLRSEDGCPWDRAQTHQSIKKHTVEESYELAEAIDNGDPKKIADESGDLLLQVVFHAAIAKDLGEYTIDDVTDVICRKMRHRHPHIFEGKAEADWDEIKRKDRSQKTVTEELRGISAYLPSLMRAEKAQGKLKKAGFYDTPQIPDDPELVFGQKLYTLVEEAKANGISLELALNRYLNHLIDAFQKYEETKEPSSCD